MSDNNNIDEILDIDSLHEDHADDNDKPEKVKAASLFMFFYDILLIGL